MTTTSEFHIETRKLFRDIWSRGGVPVNPALNNILSTTLSTEDFIDALRAFDSITEGLVMLLNRAESFLVHAKKLQTAEKPYAPWLTSILRRIFNHFAEALFQKMYKFAASVEQGWHIIEEEAFDSEDFVFV